MSFPARAPRSGIAGKANDRRGRPSGPFKRMHASAEPSS